MFTLLKELLVYHGGPDKVTNKIKVPFFTTTSIDGAGYYAVERRNDPNPGYINMFDVDTSHMFDAIKNFNEFIQIAIDIGVDMDIESPEDLHDESFWSDDVRKYAGAGENTTDLVYVPIFRDELIKRGYKVVKISDILTNDEITAYIVLDPSVIKFKEAAEISSYDDVEDLANS